MPAKDDTYSVEISEVYDPEQEDTVIEKIKGYSKKDSGALKELFAETDTIEVKKLSKTDAEKLAGELESIDVKVRVTSGKKTGKKAQESEKVRCPKCGAALEFLDWRCPECYYEFPEYEYMDESPDESSADEAPEDNTSESK